MGGGSSERAWGANAKKVGRGGRVGERVLLCCACARGAPRGPVFHQHSLSLSLCYTHTAALSPLPPPGRLARLLRRRRRRPATCPAPTLQLIDVLPRRRLAADLVLELGVGDDDKGGGGHEGQAEGEAAWEGGEGAGREEREEVRMGGWRGWVGKREAGGTRCAPVSPEPCARAPRALRHHDRGAHAVPGHAAHLIP